MDGCDAIVKLWNRKEPKMKSGDDSKTRVAQISPFSVLLVLRLERPSR